MRNLLVFAFFVYLAAAGLVAYLSRAGPRRVMGALAGGIAVGLTLPFLLSIAEAEGWWRCPFLYAPGAPLLTFLGVAVSYAPMGLIGWRIERRFGWRGTAYMLAAVCVIGPPRDYAIAARYPELMVFGPGVAPILGNAAAYFFTVALTLAIMRLIAGASAEDRLSRS